MQTYQIGRHFQHIADVQKWFIRQFNEPFLEDGLGRLHEPVVSGHVIGIPLAYLIGNKIGIVVVIKRLAGMVKNTIEGIERSEFDVLLALAAGRREDVVEHERRGNHRRPTVKLEAVLLINISPAARPVQLLKNFNLIASRGQPGGRSQSSKTTTDDDNLFFHGFSTLDVLRSCHLKLAVSGAPPDTG